LKKGKMSLSRANKSDIIREHFEVVCYDSARCPHCRKLVGWGGGTIRLACTFQMVLYCAHKVEKKYIRKIEIE
jgi:hypothetical protein